MDPTVPTGASPFTFRARILMPSHEITELSTELPFVFGLVWAQLMSLAGAHHYICHGEAVWAG